jgi:hypothetical protein
MGILDRRAQHVRCLLSRLFIPDTVSLPRLLQACVVPHLERRSCTMRSSADASGPGCCGIAMVTDFTKVARQLGERVCPIPSKGSGRRKGEDYKQKFGVAGCLSALHQVRPRRSLAPKARATPHLPAPRCG